MKALADSYDVIIVGAGNGGLIAACTLSQMGLRTLLLEKHNLPGGCAASFVRGRFEFEASLHNLPYVGPGAENPCKGGGGCGRRGAWTLRSSRTGT